MGIVSAATRRVWDIQAPTWNPWECDDQHNRWSLISVKGILVGNGDPELLVFPEEKPMYPRNYEIREIGAEMIYGAYRPVAHLEVRGLDSLPAALRRLAELGYDMAPSLDMLKEACEEQRKRKALDDAIKEMTKKAE